MTGGTLYDAERIGELARYLASRRGTLTSNAPAIVVGEVAADLSRGR